MIWGIVLIPIGLLMAIGIVIFLLSLTTIVGFRRRQGITRPLMWWPLDRTSPSSHGGRSVAALKAAHRLWDFKGAALAAPGKSQAALDPRVSPGP
jgi:hypothetical protein